MTIHSLLWRRLDSPGHDACRFEGRESDWHLDGTAVFLLQVLPQRYERRTQTTYWYEAPTVGYAAVLELTPAGFIRHYPGLWQLEE